MKLKNVGFIQQHVEKIVLGVVLLMALAVVYMFALPGNYEAEAKVGNTTIKDNPGAMAEQLETMAGRLKSEVAANKNPLEEQDRPVPNYEGEMLQRFNRPPVEDFLLGFPFGPDGLDMGLTPADIERLRYFIPELPSPADTKTRVASYVLDDKEAIMQYLQQKLRLNRGNDPQINEWLETASVNIAKNIGVIDEEGKLRDFKGVSVEAMFDEELILDAFGIQTNDPELRNIPESWWQYSTLVTDVRLERQTYDPETETWGEVERIGLLMPEELPIRNLPEGLTEDDVRTVLDYIVKNQDQILQREFLPLAPVSNQYVTPSSDKKLTLEERVRLNKLAEEIEKLQDRERGLMEKAEREAEREAARSNREQPRPRQPVRPPAGGGRDEFGAGGPGLGIGGAFPGGGFGQRQRGQRAPRGQADREQLQEIRQRLSELQAEYDELRGKDVRGLETRRNRGSNFREGAFFDQFMGMGMMGPEMFGHGGFPGQFNRGVPQRRDPRGQRGNNNDQEEENQPIDPRIPVVAHDATVEPGKTYRYRLRVAVLNPLYRRRNLEEEQAKEMFNKLSLETEPTEWTEPIEIPPAVEWFLVRALGEDQVSVELWKYINGTPESTTVMLRPGDPISGIVSLRDGTEIELTAAAAVVDVEQPRNKGLDQATLRVVDLQTGLMKQRSVREDQNNERKDYLQSERNLQRDVEDNVAEDRRSPGFPATSRRSP